MADTPYRVTVYASKDEFWPWWDLSVEPDRFKERKGDVPTEPLLTVRQAAEKLGTSPRWVHRG